ncbi:hypothetical protein LJR225_001885 [Phenylobacterium sp. LjRoot225]|uniref:hypothetical protein n=1 Tax=Phenylobacterium sp. LjRoot225 TaxID=3342285 RepID=UPI003ECE8480
MAVDRLVHPHHGDGEEEVRIYTELLKLSVFGISGYLLEMNPEAHNRCQMLISGLEQLLSELQTLAGG